MNLSSNADSKDDNSSERFRMLKNTNNYELHITITVNIKQQHENNMNK